VALPEEDREDRHMDRVLIIVSRDRPNLYQQLIERHGAGAPVILDRRQTPRSTTPAAGLWHTDLERDGYMVAPTT